MATAIPLALDGGLRQPEAEGCAILALWERGNQKTDTNICYSIIFVCKYRKKLLMSKQISDDIKQFSQEICQKHKIIIRYMETDKEHTFWTDGYFVCSVGNVSGEMPRKYIENQGQEGGDSRC